MKRLACIVALMLFSLFAIAQTTPYNVVFDLTSKDSVSQKSVIRWLNGILASNADAKLEVVMYGQGLDLVLRGKSLVSDEVTKLAQNKNVAFGGLCCCDEES
jgi:intracellular sulfur oxidation DsrE/DsrF family protein